MDDFLKLIWFGYNFWVQKTRCSSQIKFARSIFCYHQQFLCILCKVVICASFDSRCLKASHVIYELTSNIKWTVELGKPRHNFLPVEALLLHFGMTLSKKKIFFAMFTDCKYLVNLTRIYNGVFQRCYHFSHSIFKNPFMNPFVVSRINIKQLNTILKYKFEIYGNFW